MQKIKIGWSEVKLTPEGRKVELAGQFYERIADKVETDICATAFAVECGEEAAIFCSCDLVYVSTALISEVRKRISGKNGFPDDKLIISAIHTHTSMSYADSDDMIGGGLAVLKKFLPEGMQYTSQAESSDSQLLTGNEAKDYLADRIAQVCLEAWNNRTDAMYAQGFGRAAIGLCRRVCYDDGSAKMWGNTDTANFTELEGGNDSGIELIFTYDISGKITGVVANIACPAQVLEHHSFISSDYVGKVKKKLREKLGGDVYFMGLIGPAGDQCPRDMIRWVDPVTPINDPNIERENVTPRIADPSMFDIKGCERVARRIVDEIMYAFEDVSEYTKEAVLKHKTISLDIPIRRVTPEEKDKAIEEIKKFVKENKGEFDFKDNAKMHVHAGTVARYKLQQKMDVQNIEIHIVKLGNIAFATNPYELFLDYGNQMRARSKASQTFLIQLCCGSCGYLPTEKAEKGSHYSAYVSSGMAGHEGGNLLVRKTVSEINKMFE